MSSMHVKIKSVIQFDIMVTYIYLKNLKVFLTLNIYQFHSELELIQHIYIQIKITFTAISTTIDIFAG